MYNKENKRKYYLENREEILEKRKIYCKNNLAKDREYRKEVLSRDLGLVGKYKSMLSRCRCKNVNSHHYVSYQSKGIKCLWKSYIEFKNDMFESYTKHLSKFGKKNTTLDRIDNDKHYCKENCRWATCKEQSKNRRITIFYNEECARDASIRLGGSIALVSSRLKAGWDIERAFTTKNLH